MSGPAGQTIAGATLVVKNVYNANGYLSQIKNNSTGASFWQPNSKNADGNILSETYGNGIIATSGYDAQTGRLTSIAAGASNGVQNQSFQYDSVGNLSSRGDAITGTNETFSHDNLNRLVTANLSGPGVTGVATTTVAYNAIGNITSKTSTLASYNLGTYTYPASGAGSIRPHAVTSVAGTVNGNANPTYGYDANGNLSAAYGQAITWTSFNMPASIARRTGASSFLYSPEHQRVKQMWPNPTTPTNTTVYLFDPQYEKVVTGSLTEHKHYILAGSRIVALYTKRSDNTEDTKYFHTDHLGSTSVVTDSAGNVLERMAYDPWGDRRASSGASAGAPDPNNAIIPTTTDRGYTGHEHLDLGGMGLIHMNGRIYDPTLGRFLSPDPYIQSPYHSQSYNRYSYVWNNPLTMTDPTGYVPAWNFFSIGSCSGDCGNGNGVSWSGGGSDDGGSASYLERLVQQFFGQVSGNLQGKDKPPSQVVAVIVDLVDGVAAVFSGPDYKKMSDAELAKIGFGSSGANYEKVERCAQAGRCISMRQAMVDGAEVVASNVVPVEGLAIGVVVKGGKILSDAGKAAKELPALRRQYVEAVGELKAIGESLRAAGAAYEDIARALSKMRRDLGVEYKNLTPLGELEKIYARNLEKYGDKLGPTIDYLRSRGKTWEEIIEKASKPGGKDMGY